MKHNSGKTLRILAALAALLCITLLGAGLAEENAETIWTDEVQVATSIGGLTNAQAAEGFIRMRLEKEQGSSLSKIGGTSGYNRLTREYDRKFYTALKTRIQALVNNTAESSSTVFKIPYTEVYGSDQICFTPDELIPGVTTLTNEVEAEFVARVGIDLNKVMDALLVDYPYELFWYDKLSGVSMSSFATGSQTVGTQTTYLILLPGEAYTVSMRVASEYAVSGEPYLFNTTYYGQVGDAVSNAEAILRKYNGRSDTAKLVGYKNEICALTDYNTVAAAGGVSYGNPWQMIWVFDGDPETKVVCEGYSKAFQYLCDNGSLQSSKSIIVTGECGGPHMWNVVTLADGNKYLADVTNSDQGAVGQNGGLFLAGYQTKTTGTPPIYTYGIVNSSQTVTYQFDQDTIGLYGSNGLSLKEKDQTAKGRYNKSSDFYWTIYNNSLLYISGNGTMEDLSSGIMPWDEYKSDINRVEIASGVSRIPSYAFSGFENLADVSIPSSVTSIGNSAFAGCTSLTTVSISANVSSIGTAAFADCAFLDTIMVAEGNTNYASEGGALYNKTKTTLICCPAGKTVSFTVPATVTTIGPYAFNGCTGLNEIRIPEGVENIGASAFARCGSLCVYYDGTAEMTLPEGSAVYRSITVTPNTYGTITPNQTWASEGDNVTLTVSGLADGYRLEAVTVKDRNDQTVQEATTEYFIMPASKVTVTGTFSVIPTVVLTVDDLADLSLKEGDASGNVLTVAATAAEGYDISYQWYSKTTATDDGTAITNATQASYTIPTDSGAGTTYYYCVVTAAKTDSSDTVEISSNAATVTIDHDLVHHDAQDATCTVVGWGAYDACSHCDYTTKVEIPALGHDEVHHDGQAATCTVDGWKAYDTCSRCDYTTYEKIDALGHTPGSVVKEEHVDSTCKEAGSEYEVVKCVTCGAEISREKVTLPLAAHTLVSHDAVTATCAVPGNIAYWTCSVCGKYFSDAGAEHEIEADDIVVTVAHDLDYHGAVSESCTSNGQIAHYHCKNCGKCFSDAAGTNELTEAEVTVLAHGHQAGEAVIEDRVEPTCYSMGGYYTVTRCSACNTVLSNPYTQLEKLPHTYGEPSYVWDTDNGFVSASCKCSVCEHVETDSSHTTSVTTPATCTSAGETVYTTTDLKAPFENQEKRVAIPKLSHEMSHFPAVAASCATMTSGNVEYWYCSSCKKNYSDEQGTTEITGDVTVPAAHTLVHHDREPATCTEPGWEAYDTCSRCDYSTTRTEIPATGHAWGTVTYKWSNDNSSVTASRTCGTCDQKETQEVNTSSSITTAATCESKGWTTYTAVFDNPNPFQEPKETDFKTQTKTVEDINALGHAWGTPIYVWAEDNSSVTATRTCEKDASHKETETVVPVGTVTTAATCTATGLQDLKATFENAAFTEQTKTDVVIEALGHDIVNHPAKAPTCTEAGWDAYETCTRCDYTTYAEKAALDHDWDEQIKYTWAADNTKVTAAEVCKRDGSHTRNEETVGTTANTEPKPDCTQAGKTTYTSARFTTPGYQVQTKTITAPALGHALRHHPAVAATTEATGTEQYWDCTRCGKLFSDAGGTRQISAAAVIPKLAPAAPPEPADKVEAFVTRCYRVILGREPEAAGLAYWVQNLKSGKEKASEIINGFVTSKEFQNKHLSDEDAVEILYNAMLGRGSDSGGKNYWLGILAGGNPFAAVINGFCTSKEFNNLCASYGIQPGSVPCGPLKPAKPVKNMTLIRAFVTRCYQVILSREPEAAGLEYWAKALANETEQASGIINGFVTSKEFTNKRLSNEDAVEVLYNAMLDRGSEPAGKEYWVKKLKAGEPFAAVINGFCTSKEFNNLCKQYGIQPGSVKVTATTVAGVADTAKTQKAGTEEKKTKHMSEEKLRAFIRKCYTLLLEREPGENEISYWTGSILSFEFPPAKAVHDMLLSAEFKQKTISNQELINRLYQIYTSRVPSEEESAYWISRLENGEALGSIADGFAQSAEFTRMLQGLWE